LTQEERAYIELKRRPLSPLTLNTLRLIFILLLLCGAANLLLCYQDAHRMGIGFSDLIRAMNVEVGRRYSGRLLNTGGMFQMALIQWALALVVFAHYKRQQSESHIFSNLSEVLVGIGAWEGRTGEPTPLTEKARKYLKNTTSKASRKSWRWLWFAPGCFLFGAGVHLCIGIYLLQEYGLSGWQIFQAFWDYFEPDKQYSGNYVFGIQQLSSVLLYFIQSVMSWELIPLFSTTSRYNPRIVEILTQAGIYSP
jgi:hypothetical protein